ncbi:MAG: HD domain-containing phosphohydrolase [Bacillota bacterium]
MTHLRAHMKTREFWFMALLITASVPIGHMFSMNQFNASIIWPTTAFALAFLFLRGKKTALPVFSFIVLGYAVSHGISQDYPFGITAGLTLLLSISALISASFGAWLLYRFKVMLALTFRDIMLGLLTAVSMSIIGAVLGNASLYSLGLIDSIHLIESFLVWFLGDFYGIIIFGIPLIMSLQVDRHPYFEDFDLKEALFYSIFILFTVMVFNGYIPYITFVFHKYLFIPFAVVLAFMFPVRTVYMFSLIFLVLMNVTDPFTLPPDIFVYMSEVNFLLIILTAVAITLKLTIMQIEHSKAMQLRRQRRLNTLVDALQELFSFSRYTSLRQDEMENEASRVFRLIARIIGDIDYGSCAVIEGEKVRFIDAIGFDVDTLNSYEVSAEDWIKNLDKPTRFITSDEAFTLKNESIDEVPKIIDNDLLERVKESVFMSVKLSDSMTCELSFDIDKDSDATFTDDTMTYFEGLNILLDTFFEASLSTLDPSKQTNSMVVALLKAIDLFDANTRTHSEHVAQIAKALATKMDLSEDTTNTLFWAGIVHDIGKIGFDTSLLNKKGTLTIKEYEILKTHPKRGYELLIQSSPLENIAEYVLHHHEHYDGKGYPDQLKGEENLKESSILAVSEAIAAMHEDRPYSPSKSQKTIMDELRKESSHQFDPEIVEIAIEAIEEGLLDDLDNKVDR